MVKDGSKREIALCPSRFQEFGIKKTRMREIESHSPRRVKERREDDEGFGVGQDARPTGLALPLSEYNTSGYLLTKKPSFWFTFAKL